MLPAGREGASDAVKTVNELFLECSRQDALGDRDNTTEQDEAETESVAEGGTSVSRTTVDILGDTSDYQNQPHWVYEDDDDPVPDQSAPENWAPVNLPPYVTENWIVLWTSALGLHCSLWAIIGNIKEQFPLGPCPTIDELRHLRRSAAVVQEFAEFDEESARTWRNYTYDQAACLLRHWGMVQTPSIDARLRVLSRNPRSVDAIPVENPDAAARWDVYLYHDASHYNSLRPREWLTSSPRGKFGEKYSNGERAISSDPKQDKVAKA